MNIFKCCNGFLHPIYQKQKIITDKELKQSLSLRSLTQKHKQKLEYNKNAIRLSKNHLPKHQTPNIQKPPPNSLITNSPISLTNPTIIKKATIKQHSIHPLNPHLVTPNKNIQNSKTNIQDIKIDSKCSSIQPSLFTIDGTKTPNTSYNSYNSYNSNLFKKPQEYTQISQPIQIQNIFNNQPMLQSFIPQQIQKSTSPLQLIKNSNRGSTTKFDKIAIKKTQSICSSSMKQSDQISEVLDLPKKLYLSHLVSAEEKIQCQEDEEKRRQSLGLVGTRQGLRDL